MVESRVIFTLLVCFHVARILTMHIQQFYKSHKAFKIKEYDKILYVSTNEPEEFQRVLLITPPFRDDDNDDG